MAQVINTNIMSLNAQRNLSMSQTAMATAMQRLSSGLRVNSAKDDAAGLAISERMTTQIRGLNQAVRNANDGISLSQTAEGALGTLSDNLQRIRELAIQAANATNNASDRAALDLEVQQRLEEIQRVAAQTSFNGQKILDGTFGSAVFQVGSEVGQTIGIDLNTSMKLADIGSIAQSTATVTPATQALGGFTAAYEATASGTFSLSADDGQGNVLAVNVSVASGADFTSAEVAAGFVAAGFAADGSGTVNGYTLDLGGQATIAAAIGAGTLTIERTDGTNFDTAVVNTIAGDDTDGAGGAAVTANAAGFATVASNAAAVTTSDGDFAATLSNGDLSITIGSGTAVNIIGSFATAGELVDYINTNVEGAYAAFDDSTGQISISSSEDVTIAGSNTLGLASSTASGGMTSVSVATVAGANDAILRVDAALTAVSDLRATFGAIQNRFESTITNLSTTAENMTASRSRILDADFAQETAALSRAQILQQAGTAMVAQANQVPQNVLRLLQG